MRVCEENCSCCIYFDLCSGFCKMHNYDIIEIESINEDCGDFEAWKTNNNYD